MPGAIREEHSGSGTDEFYFILSREGELLLDDVPHELLTGHLVAHQGGGVLRLAKYGNGAPELARDWGTQPVYHDDH